MTSGAIYARVSSKRQAKDQRLARKFAYQALLIEELARCGTRVEFVKGPRGDSPEDQLLVQFQGMFAEYEKAQLMERYRRGKAYRARSGA